MGINRTSLKVVDFNGYNGVSYGIYDTLICSYARLEEFVKLERDKPRDDRTTIKANVGVPLNIVFYADHHGYVTKYELEAEMD